MFSPKGVQLQRVDCSTLMDKAKKAIQFAIQDGDNELIQFMREFNKRKEDQ